MYIDGIFIEYGGSDPPLEPEGLTPLRPRVPNPPGILVARAMLRVM